MITDRQPSLKDKVCSITRKKRFNKLNLPEIIKGTSRQENKENLHHSVVVSLKSIARQETLDFLRDKAMKSIEKKKGNSHFMRIDDESRNHLSVMRYKSH